MSENYAKFIRELVDAMEESAATPTAIEVADVAVYTTPGGTTMICSRAIYNDDDRPHDLVAVLAGRVVVPLRPTVNPDLVSGLIGELERRAVTAS